MMVSWVVYIGGAVATIGVLFWLNRQRRRFLAAYTQAATVTEVHSGAPVAPSALPPSAEPVIAAVRATSEPAPSVSPPGDANDAMVYIDATGRCTFPNDAARDLFHWKSGDLILSEVLVGGHAECHGLLETLKREGVLAQHVTALADPSHTSLEISGLALRDRNGSAWRAALFIHRLGASHHLPDVSP